MALLLYPSIITEAPNFIPFEDDPKQRCGIGKLSILEDDTLKKDIGREVIDWLFATSTI